MSSRTRLGTALCFAAALALGLAGPARPASADDDEEYQVHWSATLQAALHQISEHEADDGVTGFFDRYEYIPNKSSDLPFEIGVSDAALDVLGENETPRLQFRLESPTSNLGLSGEDIDRPFLNQRADLFGRQDGIDLDVAYRRLRTERLRIFPNPGGSGHTVFDRTGPNDRFYKERTGFEAELRARPQEILADPPRLLDWLAPQVSLRGGAQFRDGNRQIRFAVPTTNQWVELTRQEDQSVGRVGGTLLAAPGGLFTLAFDVDHERFREDASPPNQTSLGAPFPPSASPIGFVPDTDRTTGSVRLQSRLGERAVVEGGFQISHLQQVASETAGQRAVGFGDNELVYTSANAAVDVVIAGPLSLDGFFKFDQRDNDIDRSTSLFNAAGGSQVDVFMDRWQRMLGGGELVYRLRASNLVAVGARAEWVDRDLVYTADTDGLFRRIVPANVRVADQSESYTVYGRTVLRPLAALGVRSEVGYRMAPKTGYTADLDKYVYGKLRASYTVPLPRPVVVSAFGQGGSGENRDFSFFGGGPGPGPGAGLDGTRVDQDFQRWDYRWGLTAASSPWDDVSLFTSFFHSRGAQDFDLVLSDFPRFLQEFGPLGGISFMRQGPLQYRADDFSVIVGTHAQLSERTDAGISYSFTRAQARYTANGALDGAALRDARRVDTDIHRISLEAGHLLRDGLRVTAGYRLGILDDRSPVRGAVGRVAPFDLDTLEHTITVGVTLTSALLD